MAFCGNQGVSVFHNSNDISEKTLQQSCLRENVKSVLNKKLIRGGWPVRTGIYRKPLKGILVPLAIKPAI